MIDLSIIIVAFNNFKEIHSLLTSLQKAFSGTALEVEVVVYDNSTSSGDMREMVLSFGKSNFLTYLISEDGNCGFASAANRAAYMANGVLLLFLNADVSFSAEKLVDFVHKIKDFKEDAVIAPLLCSEDNLVLSASGGAFHYRFSRIFTKLFRSHSYFLKKNPDYALEECDFIEVDWVAGTCLTVKNELFKLAGGFSSSYFMYFEDVDFCSRLSKKGVKSYLYKGFRLLHKGNSSKRKKWDYKVSRNLFLERAGPIWCRLLDLVERFFVFCSSSKILSDN